VTTDLDTLHGLPIGFALSGAKADERQVLAGILDSDLAAGRPGQVIIADKNYYGREVKAALDRDGFCLLRPAPPRPATASPSAPSARDRVLQAITPGHRVRQTTPSKASSTSSATAATPQPASWPGPCSASRP
jgi:hypothetical protein